MFNSLVDDDDRKFLDLYKNVPKSLAGNTYNNNNLWGNMMEGAFSKILDHAYDHSLTNPVQQIQPAFESMNNNNIDNHEHHHHHHHHHHEDESNVEEIKQQQPQQQSQQIIEPQQTQIVEQAQPQQQQQQSEQVQKQNLSVEEQESLRSLVSIILNKKDKSVLNHEIQEIVSEELQKNENRNENQALLSTSSSSQKNENNNNNKSILNDFIPDSVYAKQNVPFVELQPTTKKTCGKKNTYPENGRARTSNRRWIKTCAYSTSVNG